MILESALHNPKAHTTRVVALTPEALRACADTLEALARSGCAPGESVLHTLTPAITVLYKPSGSGNAWVSDRTGSDQHAALPVSSGGA